MPKHLSGNKYSGSHTTVIDAAVDVAKFAHDLPEVKKIILGVIKGIPSSRSHFRIKCVFDDNQLKIVVRGNTAIQELYIISTNREKVKQRLEAEFSH